MDPSIAAASDCNEPDAAALYDDRDPYLMALAAAFKARDADCIEEIARFASAAGWKHIGIACCVAVGKEAERLVQRLGKHFRITCVDCKVCRIPAAAFAPGESDPSCKFIGQASVLAAQATDMNNAMGL